MTITPDQTRVLLDGATPGPWKKRRDRDGNPTPVVVSAGPTDRHHIMTAEPASSADRQQGDTAIIAAAPDMAETIAGMRWQYGAQCGSDNRLIWRVRQEDAESLVASMSRIYPEGSCRLVRRLIGPVEVVE